MARAKLCGPLVCHSFMIDIALGLCIVTVEALPRLVHMAPGSVSQK